MTKSKQPHCAYIKVTGDPEDNSVITSVEGVQTEFDDLSLPDLFILALMQIVSENADEIQARITQLSDEIRAEAIMEARKEKQKQYMSDSNIKLH